MAFSEGNYVQDNGDGTYTVVIGGQAVGTYGDVNEAQNAFNAMSSPGYGNPESPSNGQGNQGITVPTTPFQPQPPQPISETNWSGMVPKQWRSYPTESGIWWTDDAGNFLPNDEYQRQQAGGQQQQPTSPVIGGTTPRTTPRTTPTTSPTGGSYVPTAGGSYTPYTGSSSGAINTVPGLGQLNQNYLDNVLANQQRQFDAQLEFDKQKHERELALEAQKLGLSQQEIDARRREFDATQATQAREFDATLANRKAEFTATQGQQSEQYWASLLGSLSGPRDWIKYQIAQSKIPANAQTANMSLMDIANNTPAFGAVTPDPGNSWETTWANMQQPPTSIQMPGTPGKPVVPGSGSPTTPSPAIGVGNTQQQLDSQQGQYQAMVSNEGKGQLIPGTGTYAPTSASTQYKATGSEPWMQSTSPQAETPAGFLLKPTTGNNSPVFAGQVNNNPGETYEQMLTRIGQYNASLPVTPVTSPAPPAAETPWLTGGGSGGPANLFNQPIQISQAEYTNMSPTMKAQIEGQWSAAGTDPTDNWTKMKAAWNYGSAPTKTKWSS
jgi:hypothetical protein